MSRALQEVRSGGVARAAVALGFTVDQKRGIRPCPSCRAPQRGSADKRAAAALTSDGAGWICYRCGESGDAITLATWHVVGAKLDRGDERWAKVRDTCAAAGLCESRDGTRLRPPPPVPVEVAVPLAPRPPPCEVEALWTACATVDVDEAVRRYLISRRADDGSLRPIDAATIARLDAARALPSEFPWPAWWPGDWATTWRLVVQAFEPDGTFASVHARAVVPNAKPKTRWPKDCGASGLLFADARAQALLRGHLAENFMGVLLVEGATDLLAAICWAAKSGRELAILGIASGSARALERVRWPKPCPFFIATDNDAAGEKYAAEILAALPKSADVRRVRF